jgi:pimeloyl-ACP methyl ester carboxylesterase
MPETVRSADGTAIAYERSGSGPALVLVGGALSDRRGAAALVPLLADSFTVLAYDRRGRGDSGDTPPYAVAREIEDLHALVEVAGGTAHVYGHSSGGVLALAATADGLPVDRLVVYEPPFMLEGTRTRPTPDVAARVQAAVDEDRRADAVEVFLLEAVQVPPAALAAIQGSPLWPAWLALAHTLPHDNEIVGDGTIPTDTLARVAVPTLAVDGGASPAWARASVAAVAATIPGARHLTLPGQDHAVAPDVLAPVLIDFFSSSG